MCDQFKNYYIEKAEKADRVNPMNHKKMGWTAIAKEDLESLFGAIWDKLSPKQQEEIMGTCDISCLQFNKEDWK